MTPAMRLGRGLGLATLIIGILGTASADAGYGFTRVADTSGSFIAVSGLPALNDGGTVVFYASLVGGGQAIFEGRGGALTKVADNLNGPYAGFGDPVINASGSVAFMAGQLGAGGGNPALFRVDGATTTTLVPSVLLGGPFGAFNSSSLSINAGGTVAFSASSRGAVGVYTAGGGPLTTVAVSGGVFHGFGNFTSINAGGTVAFEATLNGPGVVNGVFTGNGGPVTTVAQTNGTFGNFGTPSINAAGTVAFAASRSTSGDGLFTGAGGPVTTVLDSSGPFSTFFSGVANSGAVGIDARGGIVFAAEPKSGQAGIFDGPDPVLNKLVALGDTLDGGIVNFLEFYQNGVNANGQIAFTAGFRDGTTAIFRADPVGVPEPSSLVLALIGITAVTRRFLCGVGRGSQVDRRPEQVGVPND